jgi:predicted  nucleic acid-binding Zn-ribbon protein
METTTDRLTRKAQESADRWAANQLKQIEAFEKGYGLQSLNLEVDEWKTLSISIQLLLMHLQDEIENMNHRINEIHDHISCTPL